MQHSVAPFRFRAAVCQILSVIGFITLTGCAGPLVDSAVTSNIVQEEAHNAYLLLNIIRAKERMPMHFTQVNTVRAAPGGVGLGAPSLALDIPFGGAAPANFQFTPSIAMNSSVDTTSLVSQSFTQGITSPVSERLMLYFINQGWPQSMVLHLFVGGIEVTDGGGSVIYSVHNSPFDTTFPLFRSVVAGLNQCRPTVIEKEKHIFYSEILDQTAFKNMDHISAMKEAGLSLVEVNKFGMVSEGKSANQVADEQKRFRFATSSKESGLAFTQVGTLPKDYKPESCKVEINTAGHAELTSLVTLFERQNRVRLGLEKPDPKDPEVKVRFVMRSTQSMLYFLGELSRSGQQEPLLITGRNKVKATMFLPKCCTKPIDAAIAVKYGANYYSVDGKDVELKCHGKVEDRSLQTLALVSLVYGLQNHSEDAPGIRNVRVIP